MVNLNGKIKTMQKKFFCLISFASSSVAMAHPGHGFDDSGRTLAHYLCDPLHGGILLTILTVALAYRWLRSGKRLSFSNILGD